MDNSLIIRHQHDVNGEPVFSVSRQSDGKTSNPVILTAPDTVHVDGRPNSHLMQYLRWCYAPSNPIYIFSNSLFITASVIIQSPRAR